MDQVATADAKPRSRPVLHHPLVTMVLAVLIYFFVIILAGVINQLLMPPIHGFSFEMKFELLAIPLLILAYLFFIARMGEKPRNDFRDPRALRRLGLGLAAGFLVFAVSVAVAALLGVYQVQSPGDLTGLVAAFLASALFPAISEEMLFRGILFRWIEQFGGSWVALIASSVLFGAAHALNPNASTVATSFIAIEAGLLLGGAYMLTRSLWFPMGIHAAWNFTQGEIFDIPVSGLDQHGLVEARLSGPELLTGGQFGLEASVITLVIATLFGLWLVRLAMRKGEVIQPRWVRKARQREAEVAVG